MWQTNSTLAGSALLAIAVVHSGCRPTVVQEKGQATQSQQTDQAEVSNWREQFELVLAEDNDRIIVEAGPITTEQLLQLSQLDGKLRQLLIEAGGVSDADIEAIAKVPSLVHLRLRESPIGDEGLAKLAEAGMPELQILNIPQGQFTVVGIAKLAALPKLIQLRLGGKLIEDAAVAEIAKFSKLRSLHLIGPSLTDAALAKLADSPLLSTFYLDDCPLSDEAWKQLFDAKPKLHVHIDQAHHDRDPNQHGN